MNFIKRQEGLLCCVSAFHDVEDSLASFGPGMGDFPSISNFDQDHSLMLPQFPPDDETDHHATPSIPPNLHTIQESEVKFYVLSRETFMIQRQNRTENFAGCLLYSNTTSKGLLKLKALVIFLDNCQNNQSVGVLYIQTLPF